MGKFVFEGASKDDFYAQLTTEQKELVQGANAYQDGNGCWKQCSGCAEYLGQTALGEHTFYWHYGNGDGYVALPVAEGQLSYDYDSGHITVGNREFDREGEEILPPPFMVLVHFDLRQWSAYADQYKEQSFSVSDEEAEWLRGCHNNSGSFAPEVLARKLGVEPGVPIPWLANEWFQPWEVDEAMLRAAVLVTVSHRNGERQVIYPPELASKPSPTE